MERAPVRHKRATAPLDEAARARLWGCLITAAAGDGSGSGSERSAEGSSPELSDLLDSFYGDGDGDGDEAVEVSAGWRRRGSESGCGGEGLRSREGEFLEGLVFVGRGDLVGERIKAAAELSWRSGAADLEAEGMGERGLKRMLVRRLREEGFDAGLCTSRGDKTTTGLTATAHEYVDVVADGGCRYIVEPNLVAEFEIARPTAHYRSLLALLPALFVGTPEALRNIVRVMCAAAAASISSRDMHVPPWRRREYVEGKWSGSYRRATTPEREPASGGPAAAARQPRTRSCRVDFARGVGWKGRKLAVGL